DPNAIMVGVVNDREFGGVFVTHDNGQHWLQKSSGLGGRDVFTLKQASNGALVAGTNRGMFMLDRNGSQWRPSNTVVVETKTLARSRKKGAKAVAVVSKSTLDARVNDVELTSKRWFAATSSGLYSSSDQGKTWVGGPVMGKSDFVAVETSPELLAVATRTAL